MENRSLIIIVLSAAVVLIGVVYTLLRNRKIAQNGIEAEAVISRTETERDDASDFEHSTEREIYYVEYVNAGGRTVEAELANPPMRSAVGMHLTIRYLPEKPGFAVAVKK